jgi:D-arabinose 1-dehydrogenase-like Zn-dependent alcohol dehydrogenase
MVPYGGLADIGLKPGETVIIAPATGSFGRAAVRVALAMGAIVIAIGRNTEKLDRLAASLERVETVQISGDVKADLKAIQAFGSIEAFFDISPPEAASSTHFQSCILALGHAGRISFMGGLKGDLSIPVRAILTRDIQLKGKLMYSRQDVKDLIRMVETGILKLGGRNIGRYSLNDWEEGFSTAARMVGTDSSAIIVPWA